MQELTLKVTDQESALVIAALKAASKLGGLGAHKYSELAIRLAHDILKQMADQEAGKELNTKAGLRDGTE